MTMRATRLLLSLALPAALLAATPAFAADKAAKRVCTSAPAATGSRLPQRHCSLAAAVAKAPVAKAPAAKAPGAKAAVAKAPAAMAPAAKTPTAERRKADESAQRTASSGGTSAR
jgi:hypothetical protein